MAALIVVLLQEGDPLSYRLLDGEQQRDVQLTIADVVVNLSTRSLVALHQMAGDAVKAKREQLGEARWAEEFPPTLDLGSAVYLFSGPEGSWYDRITEVAGTEPKVLDCHVNNGVPAVWEILNHDGPIVLHGAHMLSAAAANALLQKMAGGLSSVLVLTTTDPQKVLPTIRSRCKHEETGRRAA